MTLDVDVRVGCALLVVGAADATCVYEYGDREIARAVGWYDAAAREWRVDAAEVDVLRAIARGCAEVSQ